MATSEETENKQAVQGLGTKERMDGEPFRWFPSGERKFARKLPSGEKKERRKEETGAFLL